MRHSDTYTRLDDTGGETMTRHLKLAAAVLVVLFTISGFAPASGSKSRSRSRSSSKHGGGGCSSSHSSSHSYHHNYHDDDDDYGTSGGSGSSGSTSSKRSKKPHVKVLSCASASKPSSLVEVDSSLGYTKEFVVSVDFQNKAGETVDTGTGHVEVPSYDEATVSVTMPNPSKADQVSSCRVLNVHAAY